jgi:transcriptional regulator with XRE-family HTH domain
MKPTETLGQRLQRLRAGADLTQAQVAAAAGVPLSSLQNWEIDRREPGFRAACRLAKALGVAVEELCATTPAEEGRRQPRLAGPTRKPGVAKPANKPGGRARPSKG